MHIISPPLYVVLLLLALRTTFVGAGEGDRVNINLGTPTRWTLEPHRHLRVTLSNHGLARSSFVLFQVHSRFKNVTVSFDTYATYGSAVGGRDVGVVSLLNDTKKSYTWYMKSSSSVATNVIMVVSPYAKGDPLPGGCNMEFPLENDPNIHLLPGRHQSLVEFQYANVGLGTGTFDARLCETSTAEKLLEYDIYLHFLDENDHSEKHFLDTIETLLTVRDVKEHMTKMKTITYLHGKSREAFAAFPRQGAIYGVVVRQSNTSTSSLYVPVSTYTDQETQVDVTVMILLTVLGVVGLLICFAGHSFFKTAMFVFGYLSVSLISFILVAMLSNLDFSSCLRLSICAGVLGGILWLLYWVFVGFAIVSVLLAGFDMGYVISSVAFNLTPLGNLKLFEHNYDYGIIFACGVLVMTALFLYKPRLLHILSCAVVGSLLCVLMLDVYAGGSVRYVLAVSVWKATVPDYSNVLTALPFQKTDIALYSVWVALALGGIITQLWRERGQAEFPACPWRLYKQRRTQQPCLQVTPPSEQIDRDDEQEPLFAAHRQYQRETPSWQQRRPAIRHDELIDPT